MVGRVGGPIMRQPYWSFIDWTAQWDSTSGVPTAILKGPVTMESLLYILGLQKAADTDARSDCHAWGAVALYELPAVILGVRPASPGFGTIRIAPRMGYLTEAFGSVITPRGEVSVSWKKGEDGSCLLQYRVRRELW